MARYRLLTTAVIDGVVHSAGSIVHKADDWVGPHRAKVAHHETYEDGAIAHGHDEPLYERLHDEPAHKAELDPKAEAKEKALAEAALAYGVTGGL